MPAAIIGGIAAYEGIEVGLNLLKNRVPKACESDNCPIVSCSATSQQIHGVNEWAFFDGANQNAAQLAQLRADWTEASTNYYFNSLRHGNGVSIMRLTSEAERQQYINAVKSVWGSRHSFILFNQGQFKDITTPELMNQAKQFVDYWVNAFGNSIDYYELINEPWGYDSWENYLPDWTPADWQAYFNRIREMYAYLKSKTTAKVAIGFHMNRKSSWDELHTLPDIIGYHWYPPASIGYQQYLDKPFMPISIESYINTRISNQNGYGLPAITQTGDAAASLEACLKWLDSVGKPYIINEWGFMLANAKSPLDNCEKCYNSNALLTFNNHNSANFLGWSYYAFREPGGEYSGIVRKDGTQRPTASLFHR